jgi:hypothetical protein
MSSSPSSSRIVKNFLSTRKQLEAIQVEEEFPEMKKHIQELLVYVDKRLKELCKHEYEEDDVDISPETSKRITYCKICMCTFA